jgi:hypothetical protein
MNASTLSRSPMLAGVILLSGTLLLLDHPAALSSEETDSITFSVSVTDGNLGDGDCEIYFYGPSFQPVADNNGTFGDLSDASESTRIDLDITDGYDDCANLSIPGYVTFVESGWDTFEGDGATNYNITNAYGCDGDDPTLNSIVADAGSVFRCGDGDTSPGFIDMVISVSDITPFNHYYNTLDFTLYAGD